MEITVSYAITVFWVLRLQSKNTMPRDFSIAFFVMTSYNDKKESECWGTLLYITF